VLRLRREFFGGRDFIEHLRHLLRGMEDRGQASHFLGDLPEYVVQRFAECVVGARDANLDVEIFPCNRLGDRDLLALVVYEIAKGAPDHAELIYSLIDPFEICPVCPGDVDVSLGE
jgi:hypothetical protein